MCEELTIGNIMQELDIKHTLHIAGTGAISTIRKI